MKKEEEGILLRKEREGEREREGDDGRTDVECPKTSITRLSVSTRYSRWDSTR